MRWKLVRPNTKLEQSSETRRGLNHNSPVWQVWQCPRAQRNEHSQQAVRKTEDKPARSTAGSWSKVVGRKAGKTRRKQAPLD